MMICLLNWFLHSNVIPCYFDTKLTIIWRFPPSECKNITHNWYSVEHWEKKYLISLNWMNTIVLASIYWFMLQFWCTTIYIEVSLLGLLDQYDPIPHLLRVLNSGPYDWRGTTRIMIYKVNIEYKMLAADTFSFPNTPPQTLIQLGFDAICPKFSSIVEILWDSVKIQYRREISDLWSL